MPDPFEKTNAQAIAEEYGGDQRIAEALDDLRELLRHFIGTQKLSRASYDGARNIVEQHQIWCKQQGIRNFPDLTIIILPSVNAMRLHPQDLGQDAKEMIVVNLVREFGYGQAPERPMEELAWAIQGAWPGFKARGPVERKLDRPH